MNNTTPINWHSLRSQGIDILQTMNEEQPQWTDYNTHDPGITLLESLCYAISDLTYRLNFPIEDLLAVNTSSLTSTLALADGSKNSKNNTQASSVLFSPEDVLTTLPVTLSDYTRWCLTQEGITGAWLSPLKEGYYHVFLGATKTEFDDIKAKQAEKILQQLNNWRNLSEKFTSVELLPNKGVAIKVAVDLNFNVNSDEVYWAIQQQIKQFLIQSIALSIELASKPKYQNELGESKGVSSFTPVIKLDKTKLLQQLKSISGIGTVTVLTLADEQTGIDSQILSLHGAIPFVRKGSKVQLDQFGQQKIITLPEIIPGSQIHNAECENNQQNTNASINAKTNTIPQGSYRHLATYETLQNDLPDYYGVGAAGLCGLNYRESNYVKSNYVKSNDVKSTDFEGMPLENQTTSNQQDPTDDLRRYLLLFDHTLNNYFAQLEGFKLSFSMVEQSSTIQGFYTQQLPNDAGYDLVKNEKFVDKSQYLKEMPLMDQQQQNVVLDYLLAQHGENYMPFEVFKNLSVLAQNTTNKNSKSTKDESPENTNINEDYLISKKHFLNKIVTLRPSRGQVKGLQKILSLKLALPDNKLKIIDNITLINDELSEIGQSKENGGFVIGSKNSKHSSFKVAHSGTNFCIILLPEEFQHISCKSYIERIVAEEIPAHLLYDIIYDNNVIAGTTKPSVEHLFKILSEVKQEG